MEELLELEHAGWASLCDGTGADFYGEIMTDDARMVLANGMVLEHDEVVAALADAPPWESYDISDAVTVALGDDSMALVYCGTAHAGDRDVGAIMSSVYVRREGAWRLALYQQTPDQQADANDGPGELTMDVGELLLELFGRIPPLVTDASADLSAEQLVERPADEANTIGWLLWHLARVQDDHVADILGEEQIWVGGEWASQFGLEPDPSNTGYGHSVDEVPSVRPAGPAAIIGYLDAVQQRTETMLRGIAPEDLDRVVDDSWDPPVTLGVRLVSIADDGLQHVGQAAYVKSVITA